MEDVQWYFLQKLTPANLVPSSKTQTTSSSSTEDLFNFDGTISSLSTLEAGGSGAMVYIIGGIVALLAVALVAAVVFYVLKARKRSMYWSFLRSDLCLKKNYKIWFNVQGLWCILRLQPQNLHPSPEWAGQLRVRKQFGWNRMMIWAQTQTNLFESIKDF